MPAIRAGICVPSSVFIRPEETEVGAKRDYLADTASSHLLVLSIKPYCLILVFVFGPSNCLPCWHFAALL